MNAIPRPSATLATMQEILAGYLADLDRSENAIADLEADLRDSSNDYTIPIRLTPTGARN